MKRNRNEEMKFIGVDGFNEIEALSPETKTTSETKTAGKADKLKNHARAFADKVKSGKLFRASKQKDQGAHNAEGRHVTVYKKKAILAVAASVVAVMLSFVTVAGALDHSGQPAGDVPQTTAPTDAAKVKEEPVSFQRGVSNTGAEKLGVSALYIDGKMIGAVEDGNALQTALENILAEAKADYDETTTTAFARKVEVKSYSGKQSLKTVEQLLGEAQDKLSVKLETDWTYEIETDYETEISFDSEKSSDFSEVTQEGKNGKSLVTIRLTYTDGVQTDAVVTKEKLIQEPVTEKITIGSADGINEEYLEEIRSDENVSIEGSDGFIWPVTHTHEISSYMEWRWGRMHNGIDIAGGGDYGQPIIAAASGTVTWSGDDGSGYGNYVMIDHGNGYTTVYGHASELCCSTGDQVSQGQTIALVGSTGNSTGPHLHFEIRLNGEYMNPLDYVS